MRIQGDVFVVILEKYIITRSAILGAYFDNIICITTRQAMLIYSYVDDKNQYKEKHDVFFLVIFLIKFYVNILLISITTRKSVDPNIRGLLMKDIFVHS
jgi:hypothetical protein